LFLKTGTGDLKNAPSMSVFGKSGARANSNPPKPQPTSAISTFGGVTTVASPLIVAAGFDDDEEDKEDEEVEFSPK
jgi:hypothetical protein